MSNPITDPTASSARIIILHLNILVIPNPGAFPYLYILSTTMFEIDL